MSEEPAVIFYYSKICHLQILQKPLSKHRLVGVKALQIPKLAGLIVSEMIKKSGPKN